jgi:hypothetical protein
VTVAALEGWANPPLTPATVTPPGGTTAPAPGTVEPWVMAGGWAEMPAADPGTWPPSLFRVFDLRAPSEIILVTATAGAAWTVVRGDQGTAPVAHEPGFAVLNVITGPGLDGLAQGVPSGNGLVLPAAGRRVPPANLPADGVLHSVQVLPVPAGEAIPGAMFELVSFGFYNTTTGTGQVIIHAELDWTVGGVTTGLAPGDWSLNAIFPPAGNKTNARWKLHGMLTFWAGAPQLLAAADIEVQLGGAQGTNTPHEDFLTGRIPADAGTDANGGVAVDTNAAATVGLAMRLATTVAGGTSGGTITVQGGKAWRAG